MSILSHTCTGSIRTICAAVTSNKDTSKQQNVVSAAVEGGHKLAQGTQRTYGEIQFLVAVIVIQTVVVFVPMGAILFPPLIVGLASPPNITCRAGAVDIHKVAFFAAIVDANPN